MTRAFPSASAHQRGTHRRALILILSVETAAVLAFGGVYAWAWGIVDLVLLAGLGWLLVRWARGAELIWPLALWPAAAFALLVAGQWLSRNGTLVHSETLTAGLQLAGAGACLLLAIFAFMRERCLVWLGYWAWAFSGILAAEAILQVYTGNFNIYWFKNAYYGSPFGPYVNRNDYAGLIELLLPLALATALLRIERRHGALSSFANLIPPAIALGSVVLCASRTGTAVVLVESAAVTLVFIRSRRVIRARRLVPIISGLIVLYAAAAGMSPVLSRLSSVRDVASGPRRRVLMTSLEAWRANPWMGTGFGTFRWVYPKYQNLDDGLLWDHAHDDWAELLVETGALGAALAAMFGFLLLHAAMRQDWSVDALLLRGAAGFGAAGLLVHAWLDFQFHIPANCLGFFLLAGATVARSRSSDGTGPVSIVGGLTAASNLGYPPRRRRLREADVALEGRYRDNAPATHPSHSGDGFKGR